MRRYIPVRYLLVSLLVVACHRGDKGSRAVGSGSAPVQIVDQPALPDGGHGSASTTDEIEPNDGDDVATPLKLDATVRAKLDPESDVDHFRIDIDKAGALAVMTNAVDTDLVLELEDASGTVVARSARSGVRTREGVPNFGVAPGRYTAVVRAAPKKKARPARGRREPEPAKPAVVYEITAQLVPTPAGSEHEPDEDRGTANDLIIGDTGTGFVGWSGDADVWKLSVETLSAKNVIDIEVGAVEGVALELEVDDGIGQPLLVRKAPKGAPLVVRGLLPVVPAGSPPFHYLTIKGVGSNPETPYQLRVVAHLLGVDAEVEPDDTPEKPFVMPPERTIVHATWTAGDVDCFGLPPAAADRTITATVSPPGEMDALAELVVDGKVVATANKAGKGGEEKLSAVVPANGHPVVRVRNADASATAEAAYDVSIVDSGPGDNAP